MTQSTGHYLQYMVQLGWFCDAFAQLKWGEGKGPDAMGAHPMWMDWWTIFYWGWWIAWSPFVGMFLARISRGRTIREVVNYSLTAPVLYEVLWFGCFGGAGLRMDRKADLLIQAGTEIYGDPAHFKADTDYGNYYNVPATMPCPAGII